MAAAPTDACSHGYDGLRGIGTAGDRDVSSSLGLGRVYVYFASHVAMAASYIATLTRAIGREALAPFPGPLPWLIWSRLMLSQWYAGVATSQ